jgi:hypothetical protein
LTLRLIGNKISDFHKKRKYTLGKYFCRGKQILFQA